MIHEVRLIPLKPRPHTSSAIRQCMGDSRGRWEGDTLVVETINFNGYAGGLWALNHILPRGQRRNAEGDRAVQARRRRFHRLPVHDRRSEDLHQAVDGSLPMSKIDGPIFEYACHEGNYAMTSILAGARAQEKKAAEEAAKKKPQQ